MLNSERTMPQYHVVRMGQGETLPEGRMEGQEPVEVRTPARRADWVWLLGVDELGWGWDWV